MSCDAPHQDRSHVRRSCPYRLRLRGLLVGCPLAGSGIITGVMSQVFVHILALDGDRVGMFVIMTDLTFVCRWSLGQERKYQAYGEQNDTGNGAMGDESIHGM